MKLQSLSVALMLLISTSSSSLALAQEPTPVPTPTAPEAAVASGVDEQDDNAPVCNTRGAEPRFSGYNVYEENDSIIKDGGDQRYTQGLRVDFSFHRKKVPCWSWGISSWLRHLWFSGSGWTHGFAFVVGQNLYTPRILTSTRIDPGDRSFTDFTYVGGRFSITDSGQKVRHILELDLGALGKPGLGKGAQGGLHTLKMHRMPKGWDSTQPKGKVGGLASYRLEQRLAPCFKVADATKRNCTVDLTVGYTGDLGVRNSVGVHAAARIGWKLSGFPVAPLSNTADANDRSPLEIGLVAGIETRRVFKTFLVNGTPDTEGFEAEKTVTDTRVGVYARYDAFRVSWQYVRRSPEFSIPGIPKQSQDFATISGSFEPSFNDPESAHPWLFRGIQFELGMGANISGPEISQGNEHGIASQLAIRKDLVSSKRFGALTLGGELAAVGVETSLTPGEPYNRSDLYLRQRSLTLGWNRKLRGGKLGTFGMRVGSAVFGGDATIETVTHPISPAGRTGEKKSSRVFDAPKGGWSIGAQYFTSMERHLSLGLDVAHHSVKLGEPVPDLEKPRFTKALLIVRVRP